MRAQLSALVFVFVNICA